MILIFFLIKSTTSSLLNPKLANAFTNGSKPAAPPSFDRVDLNNSINLKKRFNGNNIFIAESGIKNQDDIDFLKQEDIHVFLIGESLMKGAFS